VETPSLIFFDHSYRFDVQGTNEDALRVHPGDSGPLRGFVSETPNLIASDIFTTRVQGYALYGGCCFSARSSRCCSLRSRC
jgi:hypothetical protein